MKLAPEREFKTVFIGIAKKIQSGHLQLVCGHCIFVDIAHCVLDHLLWNHVYHVLEGFFQSIDNLWLLFGHVNHGVRPEELREVGTIWESLDLGSAADDTALKLCIE